MVTQQDWTSDEGRSCPGKKWEPEQNEMVTHWTGLNPVWKVMVLETEDQLHKDIDQMNIYFVDASVILHCLSS